MVIAYHDALQRLFPPLTQLEQRTKKRANNKSGVPGVMAKVDNGRLKAWITTLEVDGVIRYRFDPPEESPLRTTPPAALMPMLEGISIPALSGP